MPRDQLLGLAADVDRLLAAGATTAAGHDGLSRRGRTLRELGQKVAALVPVADAVERVTSSSSREAGRAFLDLVVMARQLRGSLAGTAPEGTLQAIEVSGPWQTPTPTREVYNVHEALTGDASSSAFEEVAQRRVTGDLRLVPSALAALESRNGNLADVVADEVLPAVGCGVLPDLLVKLDLKGKSADARRLRAICKIAPKVGGELCRKGLSEGSLTVKIQTLECLPNVGDPGEAEKAGLEMWKGKKKEVKLAALSSLRNATSDKALEVLMKVLLDEDIDFHSRAMEVLWNLPHTNATPRVLCEVEERTVRLPPPVPKPKKGAKKQAREAAEKAAQERQKTIDHLCYFIKVLADPNRKDAKNGRVLKTLLSLAQHGERAVRAAAVGSLAACDPEADEVMPALIAAVMDKDSEVAVAAVEGLHYATPSEKREAALPILLERAGDPKAEEDIVCGILDLLPENMTNFGGKILNLMRRLIRGKNPSIRDRVVDALAEIGVPAQKLLPEVFEYLKAGSGNRICDDVFVNIEPEGTRSIPALITLLGERKASVRASALEGLTGYGPKAQAAEELVAKLTKDRDWWVRSRAEDALKAIQGRT